MAGLMNDGPLSQPKVGDVVAFYGIYRGRFGWHHLQDDYEGFGLTPEWAYQECLSKIAAGARRVEALSN